MTDRQKRKDFAHLIGKEIYIVLKSTGMTRSGILLSEADNSVKIKGRNRVSLIPKSEISVIDEKSDNNGYTA